jgi:uncharacterized protein YndB with AHSA1/START domain
LIPTCTNCNERRRNMAVSNASTSAATNTAEREFVITRVFDAPRDLMWKAYSEFERLERWWGSKGFTTPVCKIDLRPGGVMHFCMRSPEGRDFWNKGVFREVVEPERIVSTNSFSDEEGNLVQPAHYGMSPDWPAGMLVTVTFAEHEGQVSHPPCGKTAASRHGGDRS